MLFGSTVNFEGAQVLADGEPVAVILADLTDKTFTARFDDAESARALEEIDLREPVFVVDEASFQRAELRYSASLPFNEVTLVPRRLRVAAGTVEMVMGKSRYSMYRAIRDQIEKLPLADRLAIIDRPTGPPATTRHASGVNCTLRTADGCLLTTVRSTLNDTGVGCLSIAMSEGANEGDLLADGVHGDVYDPRVTALRGFREELGLEPTDIEQLTLHSLFAYVADLTLSILGHAQTSLTSEQVLLRQRDAIDGAEAGQVMFHEFSLETFEQLIEDDSHGWVGWGIPGMLGTARLVFGTDADSLVARHIVTPVSPATSF